MSGDEREAALALKMLDERVRAELIRIGNLDISSHMLADINDLESAWDGVCPNGSKWAENRGSER